MRASGSVLVVCTGNVCRSPYIERRLRAELAGTGIEVSSAGTAALVGRDMDPRSKELLQAVGADAERFSARDLTPALVAGADLVLTAAREHRAAAARLHPAALRRAMTLRDIADLLAGVGPADVLAAGGAGTWVAQTTAFAASRRGRVSARQEGVDVTDPIGRPRATFEQMAAEVEDALGPVVRVLRGAPAPGPVGPTR